MKIWKRISFKRGRVTLYSALAVLLLVAASCAPGAQPTPSPSKPAPTMTPAKLAEPTPTVAPAKPAPVLPVATPKATIFKYGSIGALSEAPTFIALEKGFFKEEGIDLEVVNFRTSAEMIAPLGTGQLDGGLLAISPALLAAVDRGVGLKVVVSGGQARPGWDPQWTVLRKDLADAGQVKTPQDLKGRKVAIPFVGSPSHIDLGLILAEGGLKAEDIELVILPFPEQVAALGNKAVDLAITTEPYIARGLAEGISAKWRPFSRSFGGKAQLSFVVFGPSLAAKKEVLQGWVTAYLKGVRVYLDAFEKKVGREGVIAVLTKYTPVKDPKLYDLMEVSYLDPNGLLDTKSMEIQYKWFVDQGLYTGKTTFNDIIDLSFAEQAVQKLGKQ